jgi:hypothetical protein
MHAREGFAAETQFLAVFELQVRSNDSARQRRRRLGAGPLAQHARSRDVVGVGVGFEHVAQAQPFTTQCNDEYTSN